MTDLKITVEQLKNYLGTDLKGVHYREGIILERSLTNTNIMAFVDNETDAKLLFYRLSELDKQIEHNGERFVPLEKLKGVDGEYSIIQDSDSEIFFDDDCSLGIFEVTRCYALVQKLFEWHFWPFGEEYFEQGLVIDKRKEARND